MEDECKYEDELSLSTFARELGFVISTVNRIVKDAIRMKGLVKGMAIMKSIITKKREGAVSEMEKVLVM